MQCLVTGGAGFIGSSVVRSLEKQGAKVRVLDNFSTGKRENLADECACEVLEGDLRDADTTAAALREIEYVFHLAAMVSVPRSESEPELDLQVNGAATLQLIRLAARAGVKRLIYSSSAAVYGNPQQQPVNESTATAPLSAYGISKLSGELYVRWADRSLGITTVACRYFNVYGPRQDPNSPYSGVLSKFMAAFAAGAEPVIFGDGEQTRDFVFVDDVAGANLLASKASLNGAGGQAFNIGTGETRSLRQVVLALQNLSGQRITARHEDERAGDIRHSCADISRATTTLGYRPAWDFDAGLRCTWNWMKSGPGGRPNA